MIYSRVSALVLAIVAGTSNLCCAMDIPLVVRQNNLAAGAALPTATTPAPGLPGATSSLAPPVGVPGATTPKIPAAPTASSTGPPVVGGPDPQVPTTSTGKAPAKPTSKLGAGATPTTTDTNLLPTPPATSTTPAGVPAGAAPGGAGGQPSATSKPPANVITATKGTGAILEYQSCLAFESKCIELCTFGLYQMNCEGGGLCLCYETDPDATSTSTATDGSLASKPSSASSVYTPNAWAFCLQVLAVSVLSAAFL